jgi:predicted transcriptional regulator
MSSSIGEQELALLRHIAEAGPVTVGEVSEAFGKERGLTRTTCLTMMERLRQKKRLQRKKVEGVFRYSSPVSQGELLRGVVRQFVEKSLDGSVSPFVHYLTQRTELSDDELAELEKLVSRLNARREGKR